MGQDIDQYNTIEVLEFLMVSDHDDAGPPILVKGVTGITGLVYGVSLLVEISKNGAPFAPPAGAVTEIAYGLYGIAANAIDANTVGPIALFAIGTGTDPTNETYDVKPAIPPIVPGEPGLGGPVESRLSLDLPAAKLFLRVEHDADDDLIAAFIIAAKQRADGFLNNPFMVMRAVIFISGAAVGDSVYVDGMTFRVAATAPATRSQDFMLQEFAIGGNDEETAENLAAIINDEMYGALNVLATQSGTEIALTWRTGRKEPVAASEATATLSVRARRVQDAIPEVVRTGVLRTIAWMYDQRQDGISAAAISGQGSTTYGAPPQALDLWRRYRKMPGT